MTTRTQDQSYGIRAVLVMAILVLLTVTAVVSTSRRVQAKETVRITTDYLQRLYDENIRLYRQTLGDSATIIFSRGTLQRSQDLEKLQQAGLDAFVQLTRSHVRDRIEAVHKRLQRRRLSVEDRIGKVLPPLYEQLAKNISTMASSEKANPKQWQPVGESLRKLRLLIKKQLEGPGTRFSSPDQ